MVSVWLVIFTLFFSFMPLDWSKPAAFAEEMNAPPPVTQPLQEETSSQSSGSPVTEKGHRAPQLTQEDLKAQQELEALRSKPKEFRTLVLGVQIFLGRFGYGVGPYTGTLDDQTKQALREYQDHVHLPITGDIDFQTLKHLTDDNKALDQAVPLLPDMQVHQETKKNTLHTKGTWTRKDQSELMGLFQTSLITCIQAQKQCIESTAFLQTGTGITPSLSVDHLWYDVKAWTEKEIVTNPLDADPCSVVILRINLEQQSVTRFLSVQHNEGPCAQQSQGDYFYSLAHGEHFYWQGKQEKAKHIQEILRVDRPLD